MGFAKQEENSQKLEPSLKSPSSSSLLSQEARLHYLSEATFEGIMLQDDDGIILEANQTLAKMTGYEVAQLIGKNGLTLITPESQELMRQNILSGYEKSYEGVVIRKDGSTFPVELQGKVILFQEQRMQVVAIRDITERKQTESKLRESKEAAEAGNKTKSEFLATMSHELRTPLNAIMGLSQLLQQEMVGSVNEKQREYIDCIYDSGEHLLALINDILDLSKIEEGKEELLLSPSSVQQLCHYAMLTVRDRATEKGLKLTTKVDEQADICIADERRIKQILLNLLSNAIKFTTAGQVSLEVKKIPQGITFIVTDTGIGIDPSQFQFLFEPFKQLDSRLNRQFEGTGLGLALTRKLARLHGGDVLVESKLGQGSRFTLFLPNEPYVESREWEISFSSSPPVSHTTCESLLNPSCDVDNEDDTAFHSTGGSSRTKRIVLAEPEERTAKLLQNYLQSIGYQVECIGNGNDFWERVRYQQPDLMLLDVELVKDIGWDLLNRVRQHPDLQHVPMIIIMPTTIGNECEHFKQAGANDCLCKPIGTVQIESILMQYLS
ncbi:ATP-binding protein [Brasilonema sp. UFV-L1]|nr:ATP-binding protein [Brasilonema sp. UFV-L1]NMG08523.1 hybrid sensor histidine kinase/response regulator [Brasilonema sp. UFV-L1]